MAGRFAIKKAKDGQYYFLHKAANGEDIATSEFVPREVDRQGWHRFGEGQRAVGSRRRRDRGVGSALTPATKGSPAEVW